MYAGSFHVATYDNGTTFFDHTDWQATERVRSNVTGTSVLTCTNLPYGDNQSCIGPLDPSPQHFTGKMRDPETGLDYFGARYYSSGTARWMLPDWSAVPQAIPYADMSNPQSLNLYTYVGNNPINGVDADGHDPASQNGGAQCGSSVGQQGVGTRGQSGGAPGQVACSSPGGKVQQQQDDGSAKARATEAAESVTNLAMARIKFAGALASAPASETFVGAVGTAYLGISAAGSGTAGAVQAFGATTGWTTTTETGAEAVSTVTSAFGAGTMIWTGDLNKAATAAAWEGIVTSNPKDLVTGGTFSRAAHAADFCKIFTLWRIRSRVSSTMAWNL